MADSDDSDKREHIRVPVSLRVFFGLTKPDRLGFVHDLSESGMRVRARKMFPPKTELQMRIEIPGRGLFPLRGVVRRARVVEPPMPPYEPVEMGLVIVENSPSLQRLLEDLLTMHQNRRDQRRRERALRIEIGEVRSLIDEYTHNVGEGGLFAVTDRPPQLDETVLIKLFLPHPWGEISAECQVVHVVTPDDAAATGRLPGAGLRFNAFSFGDDEKYREFLTQVFAETDPVPDQD